MAKKGWEKVRKGHPGSSSKCLRSLGGRRYVASTPKGVGGASEGEGRPLAEREAKGGEEDGEKEEKGARCLHTTVRFKIAA